MRNVMLNVHDIASVRYGRTNFPADENGRKFSVHHVQLLAADGDLQMTIDIFAPGDIPFIDFPNASEGPVEAVGVMAPAPEMAAPVAGGPSNEVCSRCHGTKLVTLHMEGYDADEQRCPECDGTGTAP